MSFTFEVGAFIEERYLLGTSLGQGGMTIAYEARDFGTPDQKKVVLKCLNAEFKEHPQAVAALQHEALILSQLSHPQIVSLYDPISSSLRGSLRPRQSRDLNSPPEEGCPKGGVVEILPSSALRAPSPKTGEGINAISTTPSDSVCHPSSGGEFIVLNYIPGISLKTAITQSAIYLSHQKICQDLKKQIREIVEYLHSRDIVHADLKPENMIFSPEGRVTLIDFSIARYYRNFEAHPNAFDPTVLKAYTPKYASDAMKAGHPAEPSDDNEALEKIFQLF